MGATNGRGRQPHDRRRFRSSHPVGSAHQRPRQTFLRRRTVATGRYEGARSDWRRLDHRAAIPTIAPLNNTVSRYRNPCFRRVKSAAVRCDSRRRGRNDRALAPRREGWHTRPVRCSVGDVGPMFSGNSLFSAGAHGLITELSPTGRSSSISQLDLEAALGQGLM